MRFVVRDFSQQSVQELRGIIKKSADDGQFGFFDWFEDTFLMLELDIKSYLNNVNEYHAKMVDKHNIGSAEFDKILQRVHSVDTNYASRLNCLTDQVNALSNRVMRMAEMLNPTVITANPSEFTKAVNEINTQYKQVKVQSNAQIEKCKQSMPLLYDKQWYESAAEETESILNDVGQTLVGMGWGVLNIAKDILLTPKYLADTLCDFINNDPIGKINGFPAYVLNGGLEKSISGQFQQFGSDFEKANTEKKSEMVMGVVGNLALLFIPGTVFTKFGKAGDAAKLSGNIAKAEKGAEALKNIPKIDKGTKTLEDAQKAAKAAEAEKAAKAEKTAKAAEVGREDVMRSIQTTLKSTKLFSKKINLDWLPDKYTAVEVNGTVKVSGKEVDISRRVYQLDIDKNYHPADPSAFGMSNKELMEKGRAPCVIRDGQESRVELHHLIQKEPGGMVEIAETTHDKYSSTLHGLIEDGNSFRNNPNLEKQYSNFRSNYWKMRANE